MLYQALPIWFLSECNYAECNYAECNYSECNYAECNYAECNNAECHYADFLCEECRGTHCKLPSKFVYVTLIKKVI